MRPKLRIRTALAAAVAVGVAAIMGGGSGTKRQKKTKLPAIRWDGIESFPVWLERTYGARKNVANARVQQSILWALLDNPAPVLRPFQVGDYEIYVTPRPLEVDGLAVPLTPATQREFYRQAGLLPLTAKLLDLMFRASSVEDYAKPLIRDNVPTIEVIVAHSKNYQEKYKDFVWTVGAWKAWTLLPKGYANHGFLLRTRDTVFEDGRRKYQRIGLDQTGVKDVWAIQLEGTDHGNWSHTDYSQVGFAVAPVATRISTGEVVDLETLLTGPEWAQFSYHKLRPASFAAWR